MKEEKDGEKDVVREKQKGYRSSIYIYIYIRKKSWSARGAFYTFMFCSLFYVHARSVTTTFHRRMTRVFCILLNFLVFFFPSHGYESVSKRGACVTTSRAVARKIILWIL